MSMALFAPAILVLLGFVGLATDSGMLWLNRTALQHSVDAGALAAGQELPDPTVARPIACTYSTEHNAVAGMVGRTGTCAGLADVTFHDSNHTVRVEAFRTVQPIFGQLLGFQPVEVSASATARIGSLGASCIFPFFLTENQLSSSTAFFAPIKFTNANTAGGAINIGSGASAVRDAMTSGACSADPPKSFEGTVGDTVTTKPGALDQFKDGWDKIETAAASSACPSKRVTTYLVLNESGQYELDPAITRENCPRLVIIPVLENGTYSGGTTSGRIVGFIPFYFALKCNSSTCNDPDVGAMSRNDFWGYYVRLDLTSLKYSDYKPEYGTKVVSLAP